MHTGKRTAIVTGIYGQDGSLLAERLVSEGVRVIGIGRSQSNERTIADGVEISLTDITSHDAVRDLFVQAQPTECYHLAAIHHSSDRESSDTRYEMLQINFHSTLAITDAILKETPACRLLYAGSSQMYAATNTPTIVNERTPYSPSTFYGITKAASANLIAMLRRDAGLFGCTAIMFNHESERRPVSFVSQQIATTVADKQMIRLREPGKRVDWSSAHDFVRALPLMLAQREPSDFVLASGASRSVADMARCAYEHAGLQWIGPADEPSPNYLVGDIDHTTARLGWTADISFEAMVKAMVDHATAARARPAASRAS